MTETAERTFPKWLVRYLGFTLVAAIALSFYEVGGDPGISNTIRFGLVNIAIVVSLVWFFFCSPFSGRVRGGAFLALAAAIGVFLAFFRVDGVQGNLANLRFEPRWGETNWDAFSPPAGEARAVDLTPVAPTDFRGFLGTNRDNKVVGVTLDTDHETSPPELLWRQPIGKGWSGFAVVNGFAATLEQRDATELVTLYDVDTGQLMWSYTVEEGSPFESVVAGAGPRSTPTIDEGVVYAISVNGKPLALDGATGEPVWTRDLSADQGLTRERERALLSYGRAGSPLIVRDWVIVPLGGDPQGQVASLGAYDKKTGEPVWTAGSRLFNMASPQYVRVGGVEQILMVNDGAINGYDLETGRELWGFDWPGKTSGDSSVSQVWAVDGDRIFASKGYGHGATLKKLNLDREDGSFGVETVWESSRVMRTKFTTPLLHEGHVYGLSEGILECIDVETGERVWKRGRYGHGQMLLAGDVLVILTEEGEVVLVEATPERRDNVLARFEAIEGQTWNTFALSGDRLVVRNGREAAVYRLPTKG